MEHGKTKSRKEIKDKLAEIQKEIRDEKYIQSSWITIDNLQIQEATLKWVLGDE